MAHLKRLVAPRTWLIKRKNSKFITKPKPSGIRLEFTLPINIIFKELLNLAENTKEVKFLLKHNKVLVDNKRVYKVDYPVKLFSVIAIPEQKTYYRLTINKNNQLSIKIITSDEASIKPLKIIDKTLLKKGKIQLNTFDGTNILVDNDDYKTEDTLLYNLNNKKINAHLPFKEGVKVFLFRGKHVGLVASVKSFDKINVLLIDEEGKEFLTKKDYCLVIGDDKKILFNAA